MLHGDESIVIGKHKIGEGKHLELCEDVFFRVGENLPYLMNFRPWKDMKEEIRTRSESMEYTALTVTFKSAFRDTLTEHQLMRMLYVFLNESEEIKAYTLLPDVDNKGNFHYHGVVRVRKADIASVKRRFTRQLGFCKFEYINDPEGWARYCIKPRGFRSKEHPNPLENPLFRKSEKQALLVSDIGRFQQE